MKRFLLWFAVFVGVFVLVAAALVFLIDVNRFRPQLEARLTEVLHRNVRLGKLGLSIFSGSIEANDLEIAEDAAFGNAPFLRARAIRVGVELKPLILERKLNVTRITIEKPEISLIQTPSGDWNYASLGTTAASTGRPAGTDRATASAGALVFTVNRLNIADGSLTIGRTVNNWKPLVLENVNIAIEDFSPVTEFPFTVTTNVKGGGSIKLEGKAGPINATDASSTAATVKVRVSDLDLAATGLANYAPDMAGIISFDGTGETNGNSLHLKGSIKAEKLKLAKTGTAATVPVQFDFDVDHNLKRHSGSLKKGNIRIGKAPASLTGTYLEQNQDMILKMNLDGSWMPVSEIVAMLGPLGIVLPSGSSLHDGTISVKLSMNGPADKLVTDGTLGIRDTTLAGFDLGKKMSLVQQLAGMQTGPSTQIQNVSTTVHVSPEGIQAKDILLNVPAMGDLRGDGTISPANALDFKMNAALHTSGMASAISDKSIPFFIQGTSSDPLFKPDLKGMAAEQLNSAKAGAGAAAANFIKGLFGRKKKEGP